MKLYFHGNCQMDAAADMVAEINPHWQVDKCFILTADIAAGPDAIRRTIRRADVIVVQPVHAGYRGVEWLGIDFVRAEARPGATVITSPSLFFRGPTPEYFYLRDRAGSEPVVQHSPYHNVVLLDLVLAGYAADEILQRLSSIFLYTQSFITAQMQSSIDELVRREIEQKLDIAFSGVVRELCWDRKIMHTINHPNRLVMARIVNAILQVAGLPGRVNEYGPDYLSDISIPLAPSVAVQMRIPDDLPNFDFVLKKARVGMLDYYAAAIAEYRTMDQDHLASLLYGSREARDFLGAFRRMTGASTPRSAQMASELVRGAYHTLLGRDPALPEILWTCEGALNGGEQLFTRILQSPEFAANRDVFFKRLVPVI